MRNCRDAASTKTYYVCFFSICCVPFFFSLVTTLSYTVTKYRMRDDVSKQASYEIVEQRLTTGKDTDRSR